MYNYKSIMKQNIFVKRSSITIMFPLIPISLILALITGLSHSKTRIRGGENTIIQQHPYQISLEVKGGGHQCGGSIISPNHVLTAGHCVQFSKKSMRIRAGTSYREKNGSLHTVDDIIRHENFHYNDYNLPINDLAILKISPDFILDDTRYPIELLKEPVKTGDMAVVTGWGNIGNGYLADQLQSLTLPIISKSVCNSALKKYGGLGVGQICTLYEGEGKKDACNGDSGGPLTFDGKLIGIVSYGDDCELLEYPGMYTEIAYFYDWIIKNRNF